MSTGILDSASASLFEFPGLYFMVNEVTSGVQFGCRQHICKGVVVCIYDKMRSIIKIVSKMFTHCPLQRQELEFARVKMVISFCLGK